jgi:hypothetical protein
VALWFLIGTTKAPKRVASVSQLIQSRTTSKSHCSRCHTAFQQLQPLVVKISLIFILLNQGGCRHGQLSNDLEVTFRHSIEVSMEPTCFHILGPKGCAHTVDHLNQVSSHFFGETDSEPQGNHRFMDTMGTYSVQPSHPLASFTSTR